MTTIDRNPETPAFKSIMNLFSPTRISESLNFPNKTQINCGITCKCQLYTQPRREHHFRVVLFTLFPAGKITT
jgi:hypothetical protein